MGLILLSLALIFVFPFAVWMACGMLVIFVRPDRLRPPWWDWGMDKPVAKVKAEPVRVEETPVIVAAEAPREVEPEVATEAARPRW